MATRPRSARPIDHAEQELREQEVRRANNELAAYFKGQRTEREARAALKIIKAFIRYRERLEPAKRRPLSHAESRRLTTDRKPKKAGPSTTVRRPRRRSAGEALSPAQVHDIGITETAPEPEAIE
jgi:hypothetical protein